jgi:hypothetical protein
LISFCHCEKDLDHENRDSLDAIKQAVLPTHHYVHPCVEKNCRNIKKEGYMTLHGNKSKNFFELIYTIDEPYKFDVERVHEYTVKANERLPEQYDTNDYYCFTVENEVICSIVDISSSTFFKTAYFSSKISPNFLKTFVK